MSSAYFAPLVLAPTLITEPGQYLTRGGETVTIDRTSARHDFGCVGSYASGQTERWHRSGRLFAGVHSQNDIVTRAR